MLRWAQEKNHGDTEHKKKIYFKSIEAAIPFYQVAKNKLLADKYAKPEKLGVEPPSINIKKRKKVAKAEMPSQISVGSLQKDTSLSSLGQGSLDGEKDNHVAELIQKEQQYKSDLVLIREEDSMPTTRNVTHDMFFKSKQQKGAEPEQPKQTITGGSYQTLPPELKDKKSLSQMQNTSLVNLRFSRQSLGIAIKPVKARQQLKPLGRSQTAGPQNEEELKTIIS